MDREVKTERDRNYIYLKKTWSGGATYVLVFLFEEEKSVTLPLALDRKQNYTLWSLTAIATASCLRNTTLKLLL